MIMHYPNQNQVNPKHRSKVTAISIRWPSSGFFWDIRLSPLGLIFMEGQKNVGSDNASHYKEYACKIAKQLSYYFPCYHPQRRE